MRCPELDRRKLGAVLAAYTRRVMYLRSLVAGTARVDLDGNSAGEVTAGDAEYAAAKLAEILASRETKRARGCGQGRGAGCEAGGSKGGGCGPSSRKGRDAEEKAPSAPARHPSDRRIRSRDPTASVDLRS